MPNLDDEAYFDSRVMPSAYEEAVQYLMEKYSIDFREAEEMYQDMMADKADQDRDRMEGF